ncbi:MAG: class I SAM-dependent methyltransferase [Verrucomicrobiota bacterium]
MSDPELLAEQTAYYRARASEYDQWFLRTGRYDRGPDHRQQWNRELDQIRETVKALGPFSNALEIACGTGLWTGLLADLSESLTALDSVEETLELNRAKHPGTEIDFKAVDVFQWEPTNTYDLIFFGFWLSHVPATQFERFWRIVNQALAPGGRVFFVDSLKTQRSTARNHQALDDSGVVERQLNNGRSFRIVKRFYEPVALTADLRSMGWMGRVQTTEEFFLFGSFRRD